MKILVLCKISKNKLDDSFSYHIDIRIFNFLNFVFPKSIIEIHNTQNIKNDYDLIFITGGNTLIRFSKEKKDKLRYLETNRVINNFIRLKIPIIGICYGAQIIASKYNSKFSKSNTHVGDHETFYNDKKIIVNSYHNYVVNKLGRELEPISIAQDGTYEAFIHENRRIMGIMWHPERYNRMKKNDKDIIINFYKDLS